MKIRQAQSVRQHVVAVESHQRIQVDDQTHRETGRGHDEGNAPQRPFRQEPPCEECQCRESEFGDDSPGGDKESFPFGCQAVRIGHVRVHDRHHHHKRHAHGRHSTPKPGRRIGMTQLVHDLHGTERQTVEDGSTPIEKVEERRDERVPLPSYQDQPEKPQDTKCRPGDSCVERLHKRQCGLQKVMRMDQRDLDEQIMVNQPHEPIVFTGLGLALIVRMFATGRLLREIVRVEELDEILHVRHGRLTGRLLGHHRMELFDSSGIPPLDHLVDRPFDLEIASANRIDDGPGRYSVRRGSPSVELQIGTECRQLSFLRLGAWRPGTHHRSPTHPLSKGRERSTQQ